MKKCTYHIFMVMLKKAAVSQAVVMEIFDKKKNKQKNKQTSKTKKKQTNKKKTNQKQKTTWLHVLLKYETIQVSWSMRCTYFL